MTKLAWDAVGTRTYETGVSNGVLYTPDESGNYTSGEAWNGLTSVTESPSGAEATAQYADNIKYLNLVSAEEFGGTIECYTYPDSWNGCDGNAEPLPGMTIGQQTRKTFGLSYQTILGNDVDGNDYGKIYHLVYGCLASPAEKAYDSVNDSPEAIDFSYPFTTTPVDVGTIGGTTYKPTAIIKINSTKYTSDQIANLEQLLYGSEGSDAQLPLPAAVYSLLSGSVTVAHPTAPTFADNVITIPTVTGVIYQDATTGTVLTSGTHTITEDTGVLAVPAAGYIFGELDQTYWEFEYSA